MITGFRIEGYRGFKSLQANQLGRINLLVGRNNAGKTSLMEALFIALARGNPTGLWQLLVTRGEGFVDVPEPGRAIVQEMQVAHLFSGHAPETGAGFSIETQEDGKTQKTQVEIKPTDRNLTPALLQLLRLNESAAGPTNVSLVISVSTDGAAPLVQVPLTIRGGLRQDIAFNAAHLMGFPSRESLPPVVFKNSDPEPVNQLQAAFGQIALSPEEDRLIKVLQIIEPKITRIANTGQQPVGVGWPTRGGFVVKMEGSETAIPIGSMGDGIWRLLSLALLFSRSKGGYVLVDEIDTGLHHSVMEKLWDFVYKSAELLNFQLFATTHSDDCVRSLAYVCRENVRVGSNVTLHRVEKGNPKTISYNEAEIIALAKAHVESR